LIEKASDLMKAGFLISIEEASWIGEVKEGEVA
jgi:hypothetical protein